MTDETLGWKILSYDEEGRPLLRYDSHRDEIVNVQTGEVVKGH